MLAANDFNPNLSYAEQNKRSDEGRKALQEAGAEYVPSMKHYKFPEGHQLEGWSISSPSYVNSIVAPSGSVVAYPPGVSMWTADNSLKVRYASVADALAAAEASTAE